MTAAPFRTDLPWPVGGEASARDRWLRITAGPEWDEQTTLMGNGLGPPDEIAHNSHGGGVWFTDAGAEIFETERFAGGLAGSYWGSAYSDEDFDTHYPTLASWLDWKFAETWALRLRYDFGYSWVDQSRFATTHSVGPRFYKTWGEAGNTEVRMEYYDYDFHLALPDVPTEDTPIDGLCVSPPGTPSSRPCGPFQKFDGPRRDRSGWGFVFAGEHRVRFDLNDTEIRGGYVYQHYIPDGAEFHNQSHELWIEGTTALPFGATLNANVTFLFQGARNVPSFPNPSVVVPNQVYSLPGFRRHDRIWRTYLAVGRPISEHLAASVEYAFTDHDSNLEAYDFRGHRIGAYVTLHFD
ncbi:MAG: hypothetical protein ACE5FL_04675 [Myxococcota bacterium]